MSYDPHRSLTPAQRWNNRAVTALQILGVTAILVAFLLDRRSVPQLSLFIAGMAMLIAAACLGRYGEEEMPDE